MSKECCSTDEKQSIVSPKQKHEEGHDHDHSHGQNDKSIFQLFLPALLSFALLCLGLVLQYWLTPDWFSEAFRLALYLAAYIPVGFPVVKEAFISIKHGDRSEERRVGKEVNS